MNTRSTATSEAGKSRWDKDAARVATHVRDWLNTRVTFTHPTDATVATMWTLGTYVYGAFETYPYLLITSDNPGAGKSTLGRALHNLIPNSERVDAASVPAIIRLLRNGETVVTLIIDEFDNLLDSKIDSARFYAVLNSGYQRDGTHALCEPDGGTGRTESVYRLPTGGPKALVGLVYRAMKPSLRQRCLPITLETESVEAFRARKDDFARPDPWILSDLETYVTPLIKRIKVRRDNDLPNGIPIVHRNHELWSPLLALAEELGPDWLADTYSAAQRYMVDERDAQATGPDLFDQALQRALRERRLRAKNYADPQLAPLPMGRFGLCNEDFGWPDDRKQSFAGLSLVFDQKTRRAELRWRAKDTPAIVAAMNHSRFGGDRFTESDLRETYDRANRLRRTASHRTIPESMHPGEKQQALIVLDVSGWAWHWPNPTEEMP